MRTKVWAISDQIKFMLEERRIAHAAATKDVQDGRATNEDFKKRLAPYNAVIETLKGVKAAQRPRQIFGSQGG